MGVHPDALTTVRTAMPDVLLQDAGLIGADALREIRQFSASVHPTRIVLLTSGQEQAARSAMAAGLVDDVASRSSDLETLERVLRRAAAATAAPSVPQQDRGDGGQVESLTPREQEVVDLLVAGYSTDQMSAELGIRSSTVHTHVQGVLRKFGARSRLQAVSTYLACIAPAHTATRGYRHVGVGSHR